MCPRALDQNFADDLVAIATGSDIGEIEASLQSNTDLLLEWSQEEGMAINPD